MTSRDLKGLFDYHYWATGKLLAVVGQLTPEQFAQNVAGSYGSVRNTLVHTMSAEWGWMDRCGGTKRGPALKADDFPTPALLIEKWTWVEARMREFLAGLTDDDLKRVVTFSFGGPEQSKTVGHLLQHAAIHAVHHRGQTSLLLRALGVPPGNYDFLLYDSARMSPA